MLIITIIPLQNKRRRLARLGVHRHMFTRSLSPGPTYVILSFLSVRCEEADMRKARATTHCWFVAPRPVAPHAPRSRSPRRKSKQRESHAKMRCEPTRSHSMTTWSLSTKGFLCILTSSFSQFFGDTI
jgi:hypothetical protein